MDNKELRIEAACRGFYNDPSGLTDWDKMARVEPALAERYRASMARAPADADEVTIPSADETVRHIADYCLAPGGGMTDDDGRMDYLSRWLRERVAKHLASRGYRKVV